MASEEIKSVQLALTTALQEVLALPANANRLKYEITSLNFVNQAGTNRTVDLNFVEDGGAGATTNLLLGKDSALPANGTLSYDDLPIVLENPGDGIQALASANSAVVINVKYKMINPVGRGGV